MIARNFAALGGDSPPASISMDISQKEIPAKEELINLDIIPDEVLDNQVSSSDDDDKVHCLRYGDKIRLSLTEDVECCLCSDGFGTARVYYQKTASKDTSQIFMVVPTIEYSNATTLKRSLNDMANIRGEDDYKAKVLAEMSINRKAYNRLIGKPVEYNSHIQLVHERTQQYVSIDENIKLNELKDSYGDEHIEELKEESVQIKKNEMKVYSLKLTTRPSNKTRLMFLPVQQYQASGCILENEYFYLAYSDATLLNKYFHLFIPKESNEKDISYLVHLYDRAKSQLRYSEVIEENSKHNCRNLIGKMISIEHIELPLLLSVQCKKLRMQPNEDNKVSQSKLSNFFNDNTDKENYIAEYTSYGLDQDFSNTSLWTATADRSNKDSVILTNCMYEGVMLKSLQLDKLKTKNDNDKLIRNGSIVRLYEADQARYLAVSKFECDKFETIYDTYNDEYKQHFRIKTLDKKWNYNYLRLFEVSKFIRDYDEAKLIKKYNFTKASARWILSRALNTLKKLCNNNSVKLYNPHSHYGCINNDVQRTMRESMCLEALWNLLQELYSNNEDKCYKEYLWRRESGELLCSLLMTIVDAVKINSDNQLYTFRGGLQNIAEYIGFQLPGGQDELALFTVVEGSESILQDASLDAMVTHFLMKLDKASFEKRMREYKILQLLVMMFKCKKKVLRNVQYVLHDSFNKDSVKSLKFAFNESTHEIYVIAAKGEEYRFGDQVSNSSLEQNVLSYFKNQLLLTASVIHMNPEILKDIKSKFPVNLIMKNLALESLNVGLKASLAEVLRSLFENTENLESLERPKLFLELTGDMRERDSEFITQAELNNLKDIMLKFFSEVKGELEGRRFDYSSSKDLFCSYLKLLTFIIRHDFKFDDNSDNNIKAKYDLIYAAFTDCCLYFNSSFNTNKESTLKKMNSTINKTVEERSSDESDSKDEAEKKTRQDTDSEKEENVMDEDTPYCLSYCYPYVEALKDMEQMKQEEGNSKGDSKREIVQLEVCNFLSEINFMFQNVGLELLGFIMSKNHRSDAKEIAQECIEYVRQVFSIYVKDNPTLSLEAKEVSKRKTLSQLFSQYKTEMNDQAKELPNLLANQLTLTKSTEISTSILRTIIRCLLPRTQFMGYIKKLWITSNKNVLKKYDVIDKLLIDINIALNDLIALEYLVDESRVNDNLLGALAKWSENMENLYKLFDVVKSDIMKKDEEFNKVFIMRKLYIPLTTFLKQSRKIKLSVISDYFNKKFKYGSILFNLSKNLIKAIKQTNEILKIVCCNSSRAKQKLIKHVLKVTSILIMSNPSDEYDDLIQSDIELLSELVNDNPAIPYLDNYQSRHLKDILEDLNKTICSSNDKMALSIYQVLVFADYLEYTGANDG